MLFNDTVLSSGTAFAWQVDQRFFLITNWHNLAGRNPRSGEHLSKTAAEPDRIHVYWNLQDQFGTRELFCHRVRDDSGCPLWLVHPQFRQAVDVVALPIEKLRGVEMYPLNRMHNEPLDLQVGMDVFILGYPYGIGNGGLPVWKRASLATEPELIFAGEKNILVDTASRPGMSGAPVIRRSWGTHHLANGEIRQSPGSTSTMLVGIYSGRLTSPDANDAQLGITWPSKFIEEIVEGGIVDA